MAQSCPCTWEDFTKWIIPYVSSPKDEFKRPPSDMIQCYVRRVAYDFATKTGVLRRKVYADQACGVGDYPVPCLEQEDILSYKSVRVNGQLLYPEQYEIKEDVLYLINKPCDDLAGAICIEYSYAPCLDGSCEVPEDFCSRYREAIISGTLAHLLGMPNMDWFSAPSAEIHRGFYDSYISRGKVDIRKRKSSSRKSMYDIRTRFIR